MEQVAAGLSRYNMLAPGARVMVAVSGGPDSVCLFHVLRQMNLRVAGIVHVNHKLRGRASEEDECFVAAMARDAGVEFFRATAQLPPGNLEQNARRARRDFFHDLIQRGVADKIALGHTRDDQAETVLFRLLRGSGLAGLAGILPVTAEGLIRPLLGITRAEVERFLEDQNIRWRVDASNQESRFARNRIRHGLLPQLRQDWNPRLAESLAHLADLAYEEERWWAAYIAQLGREVLVPAPGAVEIAAGSLDALPRAVARRLIRHAIRQARGSLRGIQFRHIESILELPATGARVGMAGIRALRSFDWLRLEASNPPDPQSGPIGVPGRRAAPDGNSMICLDVIRRKTGSAPCVTLKSDLFLPQIPEQLTLRGWWPGDRYRPIGHTGDWKLKELFQRERVPSWRRPFWPILCYGDKILWAREFGPSAEFSDCRKPCQLRIREIPAQE